MFLARPGLFLIEWACNAPHVLTWIAEAFSREWWSARFEPPPSATVALMSQPGANQFRFSPLQRRQRHCDRIAFPIWVVDGPSISRLAVIAICRQRLAPLILGRESSDMGGLLLPWATTNGVEGSWMVATPGKRSRAGGTEAQWGDDFRQPFGDFRLPTRRTDPYPTSKLHDSVGWQLRGPRRSSSDLLSVSG